ncbi:MAG: MATE family efflux transporter [Burkholderiales bacterium]
MRRKLAADIYRLAWPVLVAQLAVICYGVIDTVVAGRYSTQDLAAVGIGAAIYFSVFVALMGVLIALSPIVAQLLGAGRHGEIGEQVRQGMWLTLALALLSVAVFAHPEPLLALSRPDPEVERKVRSYLAVAAWGAPAGLAFRLFASYTTALSLPRVMMGLNLAGLALKVPLTFAFVFGHAGAPELGATGCALATTVVNWLVCIAAWTWCAQSPRYARYGVFARWSWPRLRDLRHLVALGVPIGLTFFIDVTAFTFIALFVARLGAVHSAAHQIAANVAAVMYMLPLALGNGVGVLVAQAVGARKLDVARSLGMTGMGLAAILAGIASAALVLGAAALAAIYTDDGAVRALAVGALVLVAVYHVFDALQVVAVSALRGYKRAVVPMLISAFCLWGVGLAGGYVAGLTGALDLPALGLRGPYGVRGFWGAASVGLAVAFAGTFAYYLVVSKPRGRRRTRDVAPEDRGTGAGVSL